MPRRVNHDPRATDPHSSPVRYLGLRFLTMPAADSVLRYEAIGVFLTVFIFVLVALS